MHATVHTTFASYLAALAATGTDTTSFRLVKGARSMCPVFELNFGDGSEPQFLGSEADAISTLNVAVRALEEANGV